MASGTADHRRHRQAGQASLVSRYDSLRLEIYRSARKHGVLDDDAASTNRCSAILEDLVAEKKSHGRTSTGIELTDDVLDRMAQEAEEGLDVSKLRRRPGRPAMGSGPADTLPVRLDPELRKAVDDRAAAEHTTASHVVREALRRYLKAG